MRCINKPQSRIIRCIIGLDFLPLTKASLSVSLPDIQRCPLLFNAECELLFRSPCVQLCAHCTTDTQPISAWQNKIKKSQEKLDGVKSVIIYFNTLKYHNNLQHPRAFLPLCFVGVGGRCCSDILFSGPRVRGPLGSFKLQLFHKQLLSVRSLSAC